MSSRRRRARRPPLSNCTLKRRRAARSSLRRPLCIYNHVMLMMKGPLVFYIDQTTADAPEPL